MKSFSGIYYMVSRSTPPGDTGLTCALGYNKNRTRTLPSRRNFEKRLTNNLNRTSHDRSRRLLLVAGPFPGAPDAGLELLLACPHPRRVVLLGHLDAAVAEQR